MEDKESPPTTRSGPETLGVLGSTLKPGVDSSTLTETALLTHEIAVTASKIETSEDTRNFSPSRRGCRFEDETETLRIFDVYSQGNCFLECKIDLAAEICGCVPWNYPSLEDSRICSPKGNWCFENSVINVSESLTFNDCGCLPACNRIQYDYELSQIRELELYFGTEGNDYLKVVDYIQDGALEIYGGKLSGYLKDEGDRLFDPLVAWFKFHASRTKKPGVNMSFVKKRIITDMSLVNVYFKSPTAFHIQRRNRLTLSGVLGNVGGTLGLFLGVSIISIGEILSFFFGLVFKAFSRFQTT